VFNPKRIIPTLKKQEAMLGLGVMILREHCERDEAWASSQDSQATTESQESDQSEN
jgi:hypothetical protein